MSAPDDGLTKLDDLIKDAHLVNAQNEDSLTNVAQLSNFELELSEGVKPDTASGEVPSKYKVEKSNTDTSYAVLKQIAYLGCSVIENASSEAEMLKIMHLLNKECQNDPIDVVLYVPRSAHGIVRMFGGDEGTAEMVNFPIHRIRFCARGQLNTSEKECFALAFTQQNATASEPALHYCHVFRCLTSEGAGKALLCFVNAFCNNKTSNIESSLTAQNEQEHEQKGVSDGGTKFQNSKSFVVEDEEDYQFDAFLEMKVILFLLLVNLLFIVCHFIWKFIWLNLMVLAYLLLALQEEDPKKGFTLCPQEKNCFKLRRDREKRVVVVLQQTSGPKPLVVKKCFGLLLAAGRNLRQSDMHLLDMQSMGRGNDNKNYIIEAVWNPHAQSFEVLNTETPRETRVFMTVAVDIIFVGIDEPIRFIIECKARIFHEHERFWYVTRRPVVEKYFLTLKVCFLVFLLHMGQDSNHSKTESTSTALQVVKFESATEKERSLNRVPLGRSPTKMPTQLIHPADDDDSDSDEPLLSGSGEVNQECPEDVRTAWEDILKEWKKDTSGTRPEGLANLILNGVPDVLRGEVWQCLANVQADPELTQTYRLLLGKECPSEQVILRDIHRTFPAHDFFKEAGGEGQELLYRISKAYSLYDEEVNYCQGLSFLAAALLLHMPEEQAFCTLVKIMFDYGLRDLFKLGFDILHLRFYQLQRLIEDYVPDLFAHFYDLGVETHMYASQWFLTLFTAKFPLQMVYLIVDLFLSEGMNTIFHISLALLKDSKKELLQLDFEGALKYFRVVLPRKYRNEASAKELIHQAVNFKISHKRLSKYEKEYYSLKEKELQSQDPLERLERENLRLNETVLRLERENDDLAHELVTSKIELRRNLDTQSLIQAEDSVESLQNQLERCTRANKDLEDENLSLHDEYERVKEMCRREVLRLEGESARAQGIIANYKQICSDLSHRMDKQEEDFKEKKKLIASKVSQCEHCSDLLSEFEDFGGSPIKKHSPIPENGCELKAMELMEKLEEKEEHIKQIELELAQTKLALVEAQCRNQDLSHQMTAASNDHDSKSTAWLRKTLTSIKEVGTSLKQQTHERNLSYSSLEKF
uniref:PID domain-containing protein n=1 Tax=Syphacia muris TaxID=451379 RepID=A0A158R5T0_9BILA